MSEQNLKGQKTKRVYGPCALIFSSAKTGTWRILRPQIDNETCVYCGMCDKHCPTGVVTVEKKEPSSGNAPGGKVEIDMTYCKGCGICANVCPKDAIIMIDEREA